MERRRKVGSEERIVSEEIFLIFVPLAPHSGGQRIPLVLGLDQRALLPAGGDTGEIEDIEACSVLLAKGFNWNFIGKSPHP